MKSGGVLWSLMRHWLLAATASWAMRMRMTWWSGCGKVGWPKAASRYRHPLCPPSPSSRWTMWSAWRLTPTRSSTSPPSSPMLSGGSWSAAWSWARWAPGNMSLKSMASERRGALHASTAMASGRAAAAAAVWSSWWAARRANSWVCSWSWTSPMRGSGSSGSRTAWSTTWGWSLWMPFVMRHWTTATQWRNASGSPSGMA